MKPTLLLAVLSTAWLVACGGGSGTAATEDNTTPMSTLVVPESMTWNTTAEAGLHFQVQDADGAAATEASVTLFTYSSTDPIDGSALAEPVAMETLDRTVTDAAGHASINSRIPAHIESVLVVVTQGDQSVKQVVNTAHTGVVNLQTSR